MKKWFLRFFHTHFDSAIDLRVRIFNVMLLISACFCTVIACVNGFAGIGWVSVLVDAAAAVFCLTLLYHAGKAGRTAAAGPLKTS